jgi:hypothetical protein
MEVIYAAPLKNPCHSSNAMGVIGDDKAKTVMASFKKGEIIIYLHGYCNVLYLTHS